MAMQIELVGGMQVEMEQRRSRETHISKCISYNLEFEATRPANGKPTEVAESEAYHVRDKYRLKDISTKAPVRRKGLVAAFAPRKQLQSSLLHGFGANLSLCRRYVISRRETIHS